jgi:hypothetical protein
MPSLTLINTLQPLALAGPHRYAVGDPELRAMHGSADATGIR